MSSNAALSPIEDMQRRLASKCRARQFMIAEGADPRIIPGKHLQYLVWLSQRLGAKQSGASHGTRRSRVAVCEFYLGDRDQQMVAYLADAVDRVIDEVGQHRLCDMDFADLVLTQEVPASV